MVEAPNKSDPGTEKSDPRVGTVLAERYRLGRLLGVGGMGRVYAAEHVLMRKRLAVKVLHRELTRVPEVVARFEREAMAAANIDHPNIAAATDFGKLPDGAVFLVLEYVSGRSLRDEMSAGPMPPARALHIAKQIASTLAAAHALNIVHRDLKPENVMLVEKGSDRDFVKVLDFGIAKVPFDEISERGSLRPGQKITKAGMVFGTPEYMAPEQALAQPLDGRADLYALGVILFEMLAGVRPFSSATQVGILGQQLSLPVPRIADRAPDVTVPPQLERLLQTLLARDASERYASASEVVDLMEQLRGIAPTHLHQLFTLAQGSGPLPSDSSSPESVLLEKAAHMADSTDRSKAPDDSQASAPAPVASPQAPASAPERAAPTKVAASRPPLAAPRPGSSPSRPPLSARPPLSGPRPGSSPSRPPLSARPPLRPSRPPPSASRPPLRLSRPPPAPSSRRPKPAPPTSTRDDARDARPQAEPPAAPLSTDEAPDRVVKADAPVISDASTANAADTPAISDVSTASAADTPAISDVSTASAADAPAISDAATAHEVSDNKLAFPLGGPPAPPEVAVSKEAAPLDEPFEIPLTPSLGRWLLGMARAPVAAWTAARARHSRSAAMNLANESPSRTTEPVRAGALRSALAGVPLPAVVAGVVLFVAVSVAGVLFLSGRWHGPAPSQPPGAKASPKDQSVAQKPAPAQPSPPAVVTPPEAAPSLEELAKAGESGTAALRALSERYPRDGRTVLELAKSLRRDERFSDVTEALARALSIDPKLSTSGEVATLLWQATQKSESRAQAFALLEDSMGTRGTDIAYDLVTTEGIQPVVKRRAGQLLRGDRFEQQASEALKVAVALRTAKNCKEQRALIDRVEKSGDRRSVPYLQAMQKNRCVVGSAEQRLRAAIEAIQRRPRR
ncbi:MAG: protein kinase [Polyangiaceae bacterium]|nr:protein kinase [Polyangiaceae bacterium]